MPRLSRQEHLPIPHYRSTPRRAADPAAPAPSLRLGERRRGAQCPDLLRAFTAFAHEQWAQQIHAEGIRRHVGPKLVGHVSRDATALAAPEKPAPKPGPAPTAAKQRGRPQRGEVRPPAPPKRLELQPARTLAENLADLPTACAVGGKRNRQGHQESWIGYQLHLDVVDGDIPVSAVVTGAGVHDSQVAIPRAPLTAPRVPSLSDLMDSA